MKTAARITALSVTLVLVHSGTLAKNPPKPPRILGIAAVTILTSDIPKARGFYRLVSDPGRSCNWCEGIPSSTVSLNHGQTITLKKVPSQSPLSFLQEITFRTDSLDQLAKFLSTKQVEFHQERYNGQLWRISLLDPEGHLIAFAGLVKPITAAFNGTHPSDPNMVSPRIIHAGFVVQDRAATDHFYKDILGFRPYWHGGMKDDKDDWVALQVPDGTDWVEYMLNISPTADHHTLGVMNHIALGVPDIHATEQQLIKNGWKPSEKPLLGRDGKWQLNLYDPDDTRVEFMEFNPVEKPCCSEFTGPHPKP